MNYFSYMHLRRWLMIALPILLLGFGPSIAHSQEDDTSLKEKKTKEGFLIDLKSLISRSKEKIEEANVKIEEQERYQRNQQREEKAREYYEKGKRLYDEGKFDKANEFFERAVKITEHPEMKGYVRGSSAKTKKEQKALTEAEERRLKQLEEERGFKVKEVEKTYAKAVSLFKRDKFLEARDNFQAVDKMYPDHKATRSYLMLIGQRIQNEQDELIAKQLETDSEASREEKEGWKNELERKAKLRREQLEKQAEKSYTEALEYYKQKQYVLAKERFKEVEWILPNYKSTVKYLKKLDREIKEDDVLTAEDKQRLFEKQLREERAAGKEPDTKKFDELKAATDKKEVQKRLKEEADFVYKSAISLYKKKSFEQAKDMFMKVEEIYPGYQKTRDYLAKIEKVIPEHQRSLVKVNEEKAETDTDAADVKIKKQVVERRAEYQEEADRKYKEATDFYRRQNYVEAKIKFIQVEALYADYKDTRAYLAKIDQDISGQLAKGDDKAIRGLEVAWQESEAMEASPALDDAEVRDIYKEAVRLYKNEQFKLAEDEFNRVNQISPGYKATDKYLTHISNKLSPGSAPVVAPTKKSAPTPRIDVKNFKEEAKLKYKEAVILYKKNHFVDARKKFVQVNELVPGYKRTKGYIAKLNKIVPSIYWDEKPKEIKPLDIAQVDLDEDLDEEIQEPVKKEVVKKEPVKKEPVKEVAAKKEPVKAAPADTINEEYQQAIAFYNDQEYEKARDLFTDIMGRSPNYKMTSTYLERIAKRMDQPRTPREPAKETSSAPAEVADSKERKQEKRTAAVAESKSAKGFVHSFKDQQNKLAKEKSQFNEQKKLIAHLTEENNKEDRELYERQVSGLYNEAVQLFKQKKYNEAKMKFSAVNAMNPDYKLAKKFLDRIDQATIVDEERAKIEGEIQDLRTATQLAEARVKEMKSKPEPSGLRVPAGAVSAEGGASDALVTTMAGEWQAAEAEVHRLREELRVKEMALKWRMEEETRMAEILALEEETERLEQEKYQVHREELDAMYDEEEKALEASNKRIEERVEQIKDRYKENAETKERAQRDGEEAIETEKDALRVQRDKIAEAKAGGETAPAPDAAEKPVKGRTAYKQAMAEREADKAKSVEVQAEEELEEKKPSLKSVKSKAEPQEKVNKAAAKAAPQKKVDVKVDESLTKELRSLQASIQNEEQQLEADRLEAEARLEAEKVRLQQAGESRREKVMKSVMAAPKKREPISFEERYRLYSEEENEEALEALVRARQKELRFERERIREEFQMSLDELYNKAVDLYHAGSFEESHRMFSEINIMAPSYKKTDTYLAKFEEARREAPKRVVDQYGRQVPKEMPRPDNREQMISNILDEAETTF